MSTLPSGRALVSHTDHPIFCFSQIRWDFVLQRQQHLMSRIGKTRRVYFWEDHLPTSSPRAFLEFHPIDGTEIIVIRPRVPHWWDETGRNTVLRELIDKLLALHHISGPVLWYYSPLMLVFSRHIEAAAVVYDSSDDFVRYFDEHPYLENLESQLFNRADVVFAAGASLYGERRNQHANIHLFPPSLDYSFFARARDELKPATDLVALPGPILGFYGLIDDRIDLDLLSDIARARPNWTFVMVGPLFNIHDYDLPMRPNLHFLGQRSYDALPSYLAGWDVALMPYAVGHHTTLLSPAKTAEYLAAGVPVVSTLIPDVVSEFGALDPVIFASEPVSFIAACEAALSLEREEWLAEVDNKIAEMSWDTTVSRMLTILDKAIITGTRGAVASEEQRRGAPHLAVGE
jgi:UDP-galactopyranose mutase